MYPLDLLKRLARKITGRDSYSRLISKVNELESRIHGLELTLEGLKLFLGSLENRQLQDREMRDRDGQMIGFSLSDELQVLQDLPLIEVD